MKELLSSHILSRSAAISCCRAKARHVVINYSTMNSAPFSISSDDANPSPRRRITILGSLTTHHVAPSPEESARYMEEARGNG
jgi:hypothetical protein